MHICQIEIDNFKSFAEKTVIPFKTGFTTVSGPNGSGKSNIIDSVLFCLGLSSSRTMRAERLSDLINNLSKRKDATVTITFEKEPSEVGEVAQQEALVLETAKDNVDENAEDVLPAKYAAIDTQRFLQVSRRIKGGASGYTSTYYLNGRSTTLTEIHEVLAQYNISPGTYNVMMQGDVASIVNMSVVERRKIIDEIAGVAEFDRKIEQAQKELETTGANIERNVILLGEIETRLSQLSAERDHALQYQKLRDERQKYEGILLSAKYLDLKKAVETTQQNLAKARNDKQLGHEQLKTVVDAIAVTREQLLILTNEVKKKGEDQQIALKKQIEGLKGHIARKEDAIQFNTQKTTENNRRVEQMKADITRQQENIDAINEELKGFEYQLKELQELFEQEAKAYEKLNKKFDLLTGSGGELGVKRTQVHNQLVAQEDEASRLQRELLDQEAEAKRVQAEMELRLQRETESSEKRTQLMERQTALSRQQQELEMEKSVFEKQLQQTQLDYSKTRVQLNDTQADYNRIHRDYVQLEAKKRAYEEVNFSRAVETILQSGISGIHGTLAQLGTVDPEFGLAMEIAMGGRVQNVVVDNDRVAQQGIELLQQSKRGRATFLPLNKIQPARSLPALPRESGVIDFALNLIDHDREYQDVFAYALGETLIVEDMAAARPLLRKYRMVTLDGSLLEKSGAMTGGTMSSQGKGFFASQNVDEEIQILLKKLDAVEVEKERLEKKLTVLELKMDSVKQEYGQCLNAYSRVSAELDAIEAQLQELRNAQAQAVDVSDLTQRLKELEKGQAELIRQIQAKEQDIAGLRQELEAIESKLPTAQIEELREEMKEVQYNRSYYDSQIRNVQTDIKSKEMERQFQEAGIQDCQKRIEETHQHSRQMAKECDEAKEEIRLTQLQIQELEAQTTELDEELKKLQEERDAVQHQLIEQEKQKNIQERQIEMLEEQILSFQARKRELEPQLQTVKAELLEAEIDPEAISAESLPSEEEVNRNIQRLTRKMEAMEPVNMLAIEEYDRVNERRSELAEKIDTLNAEKEAIHIRIAGYQELKLTSFRKAFESVDNNFKAIFAELSDGYGELILTNPEDPFSGGLAIHAQPRGKKMQRIEAMSGGEKSLTSLAFVFALQRYMPAPFYALDEVDMNLDGINAEKLAHMIQRESQSAQFVVVSLRKPMIENSDRTIGVTQKRNGITKVTGIKLRNEDDAEEQAIAAAS